MNTCYEVTCKSPIAFKLNAIIVNLPSIISIYIITLRIHAISLVESHDLLEDRRTELRHKFLKCRKYLKIPLNLYKLNEFMQLDL